MRWNHQERRRGRGSDSASLGAPRFQPAGPFPQAIGAAAFSVAARVSVVSTIAQHAARVKEGVSEWSEFQLTPHSTSITG